MPSLSGGMAALAALLMVAQPAPAQTPQTGQAGQAGQAAQTSQSANPAAPPLLAPEVAIGSSQAPVTVIEYLSDTCPHCAAFNTGVFPYVRQTYVDNGQLRYVIREVLTWPASISAAGFLLARCNGGGRYLDTLDSLFRVQPHLQNTEAGRTLLLDIGRKMGLSDSQVQTCLSDETAAQALDDRVDRAIAAKVDGTPTFVFNGHTLVAGERLGKGIYQGGELSKAQFDAAYARALRPPPSPAPTS